jgi:diguanylate cyclase (GGDEF)-like protein
MMPRIDGFEVAQRLRKNPQTSNTSIIMLTAKALSADKVTGLQSGADDYIIKPFDPIELLARVKGTLRRAKEMRNLSPLTGLPGNIRIQEEIERHVREGKGCAVLYADLDNFKAYNDQKGFVRGDRLIQATARLIQDVVAEADGEEGFVGHVGGDDFVMVVTTGSANAGSSASRTARASCRTSPSSRSRSGSRAPRSAGSPTTARRSRSRPR